MIKLWHGLNALVITGLLLTVIITATVSKVTVNAALVRSMLADNHQSLTYQQSLAIGRALNAKYWDLHRNLGYGLAILLLLRIATECLLPVDQRLLRKIIIAWRQRLRHGFWVKIIYALFYIALLITVCTGLLLSFSDRFPVLHQYALIGDFHELTSYFFLVFVVVHVTGVFLAEFRK